MATITKTPSNTWKAIIRKRGWPSTIKTFRTKRDAIGANLTIAIPRGLMLKVAGWTTVKDFDAHIDRLASEGMPIYHRGEYPGGRYAYFESKDQLGVTLCIQEIDSR